MQTGVCIGSNRVPDLGPTQRPAREASGSIGAAGEDAAELQGPALEQGPGQACSCKDIFTMFARSTWKCTSVYLVEIEGANEADKIVHS